MINAIYYNIQHHWLSIKQQYIGTLEVKDRFRSLQEKRKFISRPKHHRYIADAKTLSKPTILFSIDLSLSIICGSTIVHSQYWSISLQIFFSADNCKIYFVFCLRRRRQCRSFMLGLKLLNIAYWIVTWDGSDNTAICQ